MFPHQINSTVVIVLFLLPTALAFAVRPASGDIVLREDFSDDPIGARRAFLQIAPGGDPARLTPAAGKLTAAYDTGKPTVKLVWPLGRSFGATTDFRFEVDFTISGDGYYVEDNNVMFGQIAFGLIGAGTTGMDRTGDAYDIVTVDYFPARHRLFMLPALSPTIIRTNDGSGFGNLVEFPQGAEASLKETSPTGRPEETPPLDVPLTAVVAYEAAKRMATLELIGPERPLHINWFGELDVPLVGSGGPDDDPATIQLTIPPGAAFSVDSFAVTLWDVGASTTVADVDFRGIRVFDEPLGQIDSPPGDLNRNGAVDRGDLELLLVAFGQTGADLPADLDGDLAIGDGDLNLLLSNFGAGGSNLLAVPEPSGAAGALVGWMAMFVWSLAVKGRGFS